MNYLNEIDPHAAQWLRNLIDAGHIPPAIVDTRSIVDVTPSDLTGFRQCHFFAGIGVWPLALRRAGVSNDADIWTGSCPCQPFSAAGAGTGMDDERHLWPHFEYLISKRRPAIVYGEQVASKDAESWLDLVHTDMEALGYAFGAVAFPSAGVGAPHIRDRTYWVAHAGSARLEGRERAGQRADAQRATFDRGGSVGRLGHADGIGAGRDGRSVRGTVDRVDGQHGAHDAHASGGARGLADANRGQRDGLSVLGGNERVGKDAGRAQERGEPKPRGDLCKRPGPTNGFWTDADWLLCRDGKWRPVEPGTFPLVDGAPARVGRLRAYGNAINLEAARVFIECTMQP